MSNNKNNKTIVIDSALLLGHLSLNLLNNELIENIISSNNIQSVCTFYIKKEVNRKYCIQIHIIQIFQQNKAKQFESLNKIKPT